MVIVESNEEKKDFLYRWDNEASIIVPIWVDLEKHPMNNELSFLFVVIGDDTFIVIYNHVDGCSSNIDLSNSTQPKWVWDKKGLLQTNLGIKNLFDISSHTFFNHHNLLTLTPNEQPFISHYLRLGIRNNLGKVAPLMKWGEYLTTFVNQFNLPTPTKSWVDDTMIPILSDIEEYGISVDTEKFFDRYPQATKHLANSKVYTQYNPYTLTSRPSNRFGGINFSALNKGDGTRQVFTPPPNHIFLQMDYDAYHPRIIGKLIGYPLPKSSVHQWLADEYGCSYEEGKGITFQLLYGGIPQEFEQIPYYKKVKEFIETLWDESTKKGYLTTGKRRIPLDWIEGNNPQKLFNYLLQSIETELNMERLGDLLTFLKKTDIELSLYTYDSFLFSYPIDTDITQAKELQRIASMSGFPLKVSWGTDYSKV